MKRMLSKSRILWNEVCIYIYHVYRMHQIFSSLYIALKMNNFKRRGLRPISAMMKFLKIAETLPKYAKPISNSQ